MNTHPSLSSSLSIIPKLSAKAILELRRIIECEIGKERADELTDEDLQEIGLFFLTIALEGLKMRRTT